MKVILWNRIKAGEFEFKITKPFESISFHMEANDIASPEYELEVITVPSIANFEMLLNFPSYLNRKPESVKGTGNAIIPEGTRSNLENEYSSYTKCRLERGEF